MVNSSLRRHLLCTLRCGDLTATKPYGSGLQIGNKEAGAFCQVDIQTVVVYCIRICKRMNAHLQGSFRETMRASL